MTVTYNRYDYTILNANENVLGPSPKVRQAMIDAFDKACRYPYQEIEEFAQQIAEKEGVTRAHVVLCAGSSEGLNATGLTYGVNGGEIITADPVYDFLLNYAQRFGAFINKVPLDKDLQHDLDEMERRLSNATSLVFLCNPNNPSGTLIPKEKLVDFCNRVSERTIVFSDEAYCDYITEPDYPSMVDLVKQNKNIIVAKTFSKVFGMAGLRIGYLIARPDIAGRIRKNVMGRVNMLAIVAAQAAWEDDEFYQMSITKNQEAKEYVYAILDELGLKYVPSHANFVFFDAGMDVMELRAKMLVHGVSVGRPFPPYTTWCRVSTGHMEEMKQFGTAMQKIYRPS
ncbi:MAG: histidinol-phosphate transaminase [Bacteroidota bacterium]